MWSARSSRFASVGLATFLVALVTSLSTSGGSAGAATPKGAPILIGLIVEENDPVGSFPDAQYAVQALTKYFNETQDGINGRPIELKFCATTSAPAQSAACANQMVQDHVVAVLDPFNLGEAAEVPIIDAAKIPDFAGGIADNTYTAPYYILWNSLYTLAAGEVSVVTSRFHAKRVAELAIDLGTPTTAPGDIIPALKKMHVKLTTVETPPLATDYTSYISTALASHPQALIINEAGPGCLAVMDGIQSLSVTIPIISTPACFTTQLLAQAGSAADGWYSLQLGPFQNDPYVPDAALYKRILDKYETTPDFGDAAPSAFSAAYTLYKDVLKALPSNDITAKSVYDKARSIKSGHAVMGTSLFPCGTIKVSPSVCGGAGEYLYQDQNGKPVDVTKGKLVGVSLSAVS
jgi:branched-chain amino acid transport system substrate-binding protein